RFGSALYPDTSQAGGRATGLGDAGARQGYLRPFPARIYAEEGPRAGSAGDPQDGFGRAGEGALSRDRQNRVPCLVVFARMPRRGASVLRRGPRIPRSTNAIVY